MSALYEDVRPTTYADVVGQDKVLRKLDALRKRGLGGRAYWMTGASGTGKTTVAKLIAAEVSEPYLTEEWDGQSMTVARVSEIERATWGRPLGKGQAFIVDEAHRLSPAVIARLLVVLEGLPDWVTVLFTTTTDAQRDLFESKLDASPLLSRCAVLAFSRQGLAKPFAQRAKDIAESEGLCDGQPIAKYVTLVQKHKNNLRAVLQDIETGAML